MKINNQSAYALGFIWGDGSLIKSRHRVSIECIYDDLSTIDYLFKDLTSWKTYIRNRKNRRQQMILSSENIEFFEYLVSNNYLNKSGGLPNLDIIPNDLLHYWWRGYFDADGCIYIQQSKQLTITSTYNQDWSFAEKLFKDLNINYSIKRCTNSKQSSSYIRISNKSGIKVFCNYIYQGEQFGLTRKLCKFQALQDR